MASNTASSGHAKSFRKSSENEAKKQHNFRSRASGATTSANKESTKVAGVSYEPKIMRKSMGTNVTKSSNNIVKPRVDQNRSTNFAPNFPDLKESRPSTNHKEENSHSLINLGEQSNDVEQSWQTFKPSMVCPNERYSLKRHQEIFIESQISQGSAEGELSNSNFGGAVNQVT